MKELPIGVLRFPGTNCDRDIWFAIEAVGRTPSWLWHQDQFRCEDYAALVIPGGFSYGDYLRSGALASKSPVMKSVTEFAKKDRPILGICNGFQILCEVGLLPGALLPNRHGRFIDRWCQLKIVGASDVVETSSAMIEMPVAHGDGRYFHPNVEKLREDEQVWIQYVDNPNGSVDHIAGVRSDRVHGLMPHPERALFDWMGGSDGYSFFESL